MLHSSQHEKDTKRSNYVDEDDLDEASIGSILPEPDLPISRGYQ